LVAVFRDSASAEQARQQLTADGFSASDIDYRSSTNLTGDAAAGNTGLTGNLPSTHSSGGGIAGWFRSMFGGDDDRESSYYSDAVQNGGVAVTVQADEERIDRAAEILNRNGAIDVDEHGGKLHDRASTTGIESQTLTGASNRIDSDRGGERVIPVIEEELAVGKRAVRRGGVRIISQVIESPVQEQVTLRDETVRVERTAVDRPASEADFAAARGEAIEITEVDEEPVISKEARVVEEVVVGKETTERTETIHDTVRRTDVKVEEVEKDVTRNRNR